MASRTLDDVQLIQTQPPGTARGSQEIPYYVRGVAWGLPAYLIGVHLWTWVFTGAVFLAGRADFRQLYTAGYMLRTGHAAQLYEYEAQKHFQDILVSRADIALPFNHPAYEALFFWPLSVFHYRSAYLMYLVLNVVLLLICYRLLQPRMNALAKVGRWLPAALFAAFLPIAAALMQGQDSLVLLTLLCVALVLLDHGQDGLAGAVVGLGFFKFQIVLPILALFIAWRRWRFSLGCALSAASVTLISLWLVGMRQLEIYGVSLVSMSMRLNSPAAQFRYAISPTAMANLRGLISGLVAGYVRAAWVQGSTIAASVIILCLVAVSGFGRPARQALLLAITASTLVSYHLLIHDLSVLFLPLCFALNEFVTPEIAEDKRRFRMACVAAATFVAPVCISYAPAHFYLVSLPLLAFLFALATWRLDRTNALTATQELPE